MALLPDNDVDLIRSIATYVDAILDSNLAGPRNRGLSVGPRDTNVCVHVHATRAIVAESWLRGRIAPAVPQMVPEPAPC